MARSDINRNQPALFLDGSVELSGDGVLSINDPARLLVAFAALQYGWPAWLDNVFGFKRYLTIGLAREDWNGGVYNGTTNYSFSQNKWTGAGVVSFGVPTGHPGRWFGIEREDDPEFWFFDWVTTTVLSATALKVEMGYDGFPAALIDYYGLTVPWTMEELDTHVHAPLLAINLDGFTNGRIVAASLDASGTLQLTQDVLAAEITEARTTWLSTSQYPILVKNWPWLISLGGFTIWTGPQRTAAEAEPAGHPEFYANKTLYTGDWDGNTAPASKLLPLVRNGTESGGLLFTESYVDRWGAGNFPHVGTGGAADTRRTLMPFEDAPHLDWIEYVDATHAYVGGLWLPRAGQGTLLLKDTTSGAEHPQTFTDATPGGTQRAYSTRLAFVPTAPAGTYHVVVATDLGTVTSAGATPVLSLTIP